MKIEKVYSELLTQDLAAAEAWYTKVLGRKLDNRPMPTLVHWSCRKMSGWLRRGRVAFWPVNGGHISPWPELPMSAPGIERPARLA